MAKGGGMKPILIIIGLIAALVFGVEIFAALAMLLAACSSEPLDGAALAQE